MYTSLKNSLKKAYLIVIISLISFLNHGQNLDQVELLDAYETYAEAPREVIYVHLNKTIFIKGEMIGFKVYAFDKFTKRLSNLTTNVFCTILDSTQRVIKEKLVYVENGVSSNIFKVDSSFTTGKFTLKAYTNWLKNFEEPNHFEETITIVGPEKSNTATNSFTQPSIDLQILGEGGHLIYGVLNSAGVIVKTSDGKAMPNEEGFIKNESGEVISSFTLNQFGMAKVFFKPERDHRYTVVLKNLDTEEKEINHIKETGFNMIVNELRDGILTNFTANSTSFSMVKKQEYKLLLHNGKDALMFDFKFDEPSKKIVIPNELLFPGMNILTVLDHTKNPILERLYFNYASIVTDKIFKTALSKQMDSLNVKLTLPDFKKDSLLVTNLSVSVLPKATESYNPTNTIFSQVYLQPFIKTPILNPNYYFNNVDSKVKYNMDLMLITQGWSSYDWNSIFNFNGSYRYEFESGINVFVNINGPKEPKTFISYPLGLGSTQIFSVTEKDKLFTLKNLFPFEDETLRISAIGEKNKAPSLYPQFSRYKIPPFELSYKTNGLFNTQNEYIPFQETLSAWENAEQLDEVIIIADKPKSEIEKQNEKRINGKYVKIKEGDKDKNIPLYVYINQLGFNSRYDYANAELTVINPRVQWGNPVPLIYLDDALISEANLNILSTITLQTVDYIDYDTYGIGGGIRGQAGYIKIYTSGDYFLKNNSVSKTSIVIDFPLIFSNSKTFYTPKYQSYDTDFFSKYGAISWHPNLSLDNFGSLELKFPDTLTNELYFFVEGVIGNSLISEILTVSVE